MRVGIFLNSANDERFKSLLFDMQWGITETGGDAFVTYDDNDINNCDVGVIFGSWKDRNTTWHNCKRRIVNSGKPFICIDRESNQTLAAETVFSAPKSRFVEKLPMTWSALDLNYPPR